MRRVFWITLPLMTVLGLLAALVSGMGCLGYEGQFVNLLRPTAAAALVGEIELGQTFVAARDGLNRIDILLYGYRRHNTQPVTWHLRRAGAAQDEVTVEFNAGDVWGWAWVPFLFDPLPTSSGQAYYFFFESPTSTTDDALTLGGVEGDLYPNGSAVINGQPAFADAAFMTFYSGVSWGEILTAFAGKLTGAKPSIWGDIRLYALMAIMYLLLLWRLLREVYRTSK